MSDNLGYTPGTGAQVATDEIAGLHYQRFKICYGSDGFGIDVSGAAPLPAILYNASLAVTGDFYPATQSVSGTVTIGNASLAVTGAFYQATQPVSIASAVAVTDNGGSITVDAPVANPVYVRLSDGASAISTLPVSGTFWQATQPVSIAATVNVAQSGTWNVGTVTTLTSITNAVTVTPPTLTKGTQGATGFSVQDLKDAGRTQFSAATVIGGVTCVTTEAMLSLVPVRAGVAAGGATSIQATSGKTLRLTAIIFSSRSTSAAVLSARCALRMNPSGAAIATSPILAIASTTQQAAALAEAGDTCVVPLPDGIEISGTQQVGLSQVCSATTGVVYATLIGFEY